MNTRRNGPKYVAMAVVVAISVSPTLVDVAWAKQSQDTSTPLPHLATLPASTQYERQQPQELLDHLELSQAVQSASGTLPNQQNTLEAKLNRLSGGGRLLSVQASDGKRTARLSYDGTVMELSDGYSLTVRTLVDNENQVVKQLTAEAPDRAGHSVGTLVYERGTGNVSQQGLDRVRNVLSGSSDFALLSEVLPALVNVQQISTSVVQHGKRVAAKDFWGCVAAILCEIGSLLVMAGACGAPEPAQPIVCYGSILLFLGAGAMVASAC